MKNKAQSEILGLLVIVVLFIFIGLFYLMFGFGGQDGSIQLIKDDLETSNLHKALLKTNTPCDNQNIKDLIKECYKSPAIMLCNKKICDYTAEEIEKAIILTLNTDKKNFRFTASIENNTFIEIGEDLLIGKNCDNQIYPPDTQRIPTQLNLIDLQLITCPKLTSE